MPNTAVKPTAPYFYQPSSLAYQESTMRLPSGKTLVIADEPYRHGQSKISYLIVDKPSAHHDSQNST